MISLVLYGRNDNYGYNLHKRAALSLNCMAAILDRPDDEILFVDYNTPDDYPTFPEAIQDTLTEPAKRHLRVLRARPSLHARYTKQTHLLALEPVARSSYPARVRHSSRYTPTQAASARNRLVLSGERAHSMPNSAMKSVMLGSLAEGAKAAVSTAMLPGTLKWFTSR